jgi:hypothetical protein
MKLDLNWCSTLCKQEQKDDYDNHDDDDDDDTFSQIPISTKYILQFEYIII